MEFQKVVSNGGIEEYSKIQNDLALKSSYLQMLYLENIDKIKIFEKYEGYIEVDEIKDMLNKINEEICNLSNEIFNTSNSLVE